MEIVNILGRPWRVSTVEVTAAELDEAAPAKLRRLQKMAELEEGLARVAGDTEAAHAIAAKAKEIRAAARIRDNRDSLRNGCICG